MKLINFVIVITVISVLGCKKIKKLTQFNMEYNSSVVIPANSGINLPFNLFTPEISSNSESTFEINDTRKDLIEQIKITKLELILTSPSNGNFGFLKSIEIFISADGLAQERVGWIENVPSNIGKQLTLETTQTDLKEYIKKDKFKLNVKTVTDEFLTSDHHIDIHSVYFVDAKVAGI